MTTGASSLCTTSFLTLQDVARLLRISPVTVYRLVERGELAVYRIARRLRFSPKDVTSYIEHRRYGPQA